MTRNEKKQPDHEPSGSLARQKGMKHAALIIHVIALAVLFATLGQPFAVEKPAGVRRAIETVGKSAKDRTAFLAPSQYRRFTS